MINDPFLPKMILFYQIWSLSTNTTTIWQIHSHHNCFPDKHFCQISQLMITVVNKFTFPPFQTNFNNLRSISIMYLFMTRKNWNSLLTYLFHHSVDYYCYLRWPGFILLFSNSKIVQFNLCFWLQTFYKLLSVLIFEIYIKRSQFCIDFFIS